MVFNLATLLVVFATAACTAPPPQSHLQQEMRQAISDDDPDRLKELLQDGADPDRLFEDKWGALHLAASNKESRCLPVLLEHGADVENLGPGESAALGVAVVNGNMSNVRTLLASPDLGISIQDALVTASMTGQVDMADVLLQHGADPYKPDRKDRIPICWAASFGMIDFVRRFLEVPGSGSRLEVKGSHGMTPLLYAGFSGHVEIVKLLHEAGANIEARSSNGDNVIIRAASMSRLEVVAYCAEVGMDVNFKGSHGNAALHRAAAYGATDAVKLLVSAGAIVDIRNDSGSTPLHEAARRDNLEMVEVLLALGATKNVEDNHHLTPADLADTKEVWRLLR